jgi:hypothetical protein
MINKLVTEIGYLSLNHYQEELCGDHVEVVDIGDDDHVIVLADGLGSGVKANILSTLTSQMLSTMIANNISIKECVRTIAETLPVCKTRGIAYSTFSIVYIKNNSEVTIYNYDNPMPFILKNGKVFPLEMSTIIIDNKTIYKSYCELSLFDTIVLLSDGCIHAGIGSSLNFGWELPQIQDFVQAMFHTSYSSMTIATMLIDHCNLLYDKKPGDDTTCAVIRIRERNQVNLMIGPASNINDDSSMLSLFFAKDGKHIVCGGTTASIVSKYLNKPLDFAIEYLDKEIPPTASIEGVDIVSEGIITINKVLDYANNRLKDNSNYFEWCYKMDGASQIARVLFEEATDINFFVGCAINPAHQGKDVKINYSIKMQLVDELSKCLKKMGKRIKVSYF